MIVIRSIDDVKDGPVMEGVGGFENVQKMGIRYELIAVSRDFRV